MQCKMKAFNRTASSPADFISTDCLCVVFDDTTDHFFHLSHSHGGDYNCNDGVLTSNIDQRRQRTFIIIFFGFQTFATKSTTTITIEMNTHWKWPIYCKDGGKLQPIYRQLRRVLDNGYHRNNLNTTRLLLKQMIMCSDYLRNGFC